MSKHRHRPLASVLGVLAVAGLVGCPAPNAMAPGVGAAPAPGPNMAPSIARQGFLIDVDPLRGSAFERPGTAPAEDSLQLVVGTPEISHDLATGRTTVRLRVTNAGDPLAGMNLAVEADRPLLSPPSALGAQGAGEDRVVELTFDNPGGDGFSMNLSFTGERSGAPTPAQRRVLAANVASATASSSYGNLTPDRAVDGNQSSQWANDGYRAAEAWLQLDLGTSQSLASVALKMAPQSGDATYRIEVSDDGRNFTAATGALRNTTWGLETKPLAAGTQGRYLRLHFFNGTTSPETRFSVFEAQVETGSGSGPAPSPTPSPSPSATPSPTPTSAPSTGGLAASASSSASGMGPERAIDNDWNSQWANGGYREAEAWLMLDAGSVRQLSSLTLKMRPQTGAATYRVEVSSDGNSFTPVTGNLKNTTWGSEVQTLPGGTEGRYVRLHFYNDPAAPMDRFSVFEAQLSASGGGGSSPTPTPVPTATPTPVPTATPTSAPTTPPSGSYSNNFESYALGADPSDFIDPLNEGYSYSWMPRVTWKVASHDGSKQYMHDGLRNTADLSFRRYRGGAFGANGQLPNRYFATVDVTSIRSYTYSPTGDQGTQFYYLNPTNYVELLIKPNLFEVWVADDAQPFQSRGWNRLYFTSVNTSAGQKRRLAAEIDANTRSMKVYLDGQYMTTVSHSMLNTQAHFFALRGTGNIVVHDNLSIEPR